MYSKGRFLFLAIVDQVVLTKLLRITRKAELKKNNFLKEQFEGTGELSKHQRKKPRNGGQPGIWDYFLSKSLPIPEEVKDNGKLKVSLTS